jgi:hypothetical protein
MLHKIPGPKKGRVSGGWRKLRKEERRNYICVLLFKKYIKTGTFIKKAWTGLC